MAVGGLTSALCLVIMFFTGIFPFATFALPAIAGAVLIAVVIENGFTTAVIVYIAVSILSAFIVPDREAALIFIAFLGYYPIIKAKLERLRPKWLELLAKQVMFNISVVGAYIIAINLFGMNYLIDEMGEYAQYGVIILLILANVTFVVYDLALTNVVLYYIKVIRPKLKLNH